MKTKEYKSLGLVVKVQVPSDVAEFDTLAKAEGACLNEATNNAVYRGFLGNFRSDLLHGRDADVEEGIIAFQGLQQRFEVARKTKVTSKKKDGTDVVAFDETEEEYLNRVVAEKGISKADLQAMADELVAISPFDPSARERKAPVPTKVAKVWADHAKTVIAKCTDALAELNKRIHKVTGETFELTEDAEKNINIVGKAIQKYSTTLAEQQAKKALGL